MGYDSDHPNRSRGRSRGVSRSFAEDNGLLFAASPLDRSPLDRTRAGAMLLGSTSASLTSRAATRLLRLTIQTDILRIHRTKEGSSARSVDRLCVDMIEFCAREVLMSPGRDLRLPHPRGRSSSAQELAFNSADASLRGGGSGARPRLTTRFRASPSLSTPISTSLEIEKSPRRRPDRARSSANRYGLQDRRSWLMRFHAPTAWSHAAQLPCNIGPLLPSGPSRRSWMLPSLHTTPSTRLFPCRPHAFKIALLTQQ